MYMVIKMPDNTRQNRFQKANYRRIIITIPKSDEKVIEKIQSVPSISGYIKELIEKDIENEQRKSQQ